MKKIRNYPFVSVIMPAYNSEEYIVEAIVSILNQTYKNFEFIIIDDASLDKTIDIIKNFQKKDKRIILVKNRENIGVTKSLNKTLRRAKGKYIIRMDADDFAYPNRFIQQVNIMERHPEVVVSGSYIEVCNKDLKTKYIRKYHLDDKSIRKHIFRYSPFAHPATIWNAKILKKEQYDDRIVVSQDYELYFRVGIKGKFMNLPKSLLKLRIHDSSVSATKSDFQLKNTVLIRLNAVLLLGYNMTKFDKLYNFIQEIFIGLLPVKLRLYLFNLLRRFNLY